MDQILLRNLALKCRGFLQRKSQKYAKKWQKCFYCLDMLHFTSVQAQKVLWAYNCRHELYDEDIMTLRDLKRIRLDTDIQMLCLPKYINKLVTV